MNCYMTYSLFAVFAAVFTAVLFSAFVGCKFQIICLLITMPLLLYLVYRQHRTQNAVPGSQLLTKILLIFDAVLGMEACFMFVVSLSEIQSLWIFFAVQLLFVLFVIVERPFWGNIAFSCTDNEALLTTANRLRGLVSKLIAVGTMLIIIAPIFLALGLIVIAQWHLIVPLSMLAKFCIIFGAICYGFLMIVITSLFLISIGVKMYVLLKKIPFGWGQQVIYPLGSLKAALAKTMERLYLVMMILLTVILSIMVSVFEYDPIFALSRMQYSLVNGCIVLLVVCFLARVILKVYFFKR